MQRWFLFVAVFLFSFGCTAQPTPPPATPTAAPTSTSTPALPTVTSTPSPIPPSPVPPTATLVPSPTPLPGLLVLPFETLGKNIPWLPLEATAKPGIHFIAFNTLHPPFNSALVRQAFAYAVDRQVIFEMAKKYQASNPSQATTLTPPGTLGRDLSGVIGTNYDPKKAQALLAQAGYTDPAAFPPVTIVVNSYGDIAPGARFNMATAMAKMWKTTLGVTVQVEAMKPPAFGNRLRTNPPEIYWLGWVADFNDPDNFLKGIFHSSSEFNYGHFTNPEFDALVDRAAKSTNPAERQELYILAERLLNETEAALVPLYHTR